MAQGKTGIVTRVIVNNQKVSTPISKVVELNVVNDQLVPEMVETDTGVNSRTQ